MKNTIFPEHPVALPKTGVSLVLSNDLSLHYRMKKVQCRVIGAQRTNSHTYITYIHTYYICTVHTYIHKYLLTYIHMDARTKKCVEVNSRRKKVPRYSIEHCFVLFYEYLGGLSEAKCSL